MVPSLGGVVDHHQARDHRGGQQQLQAARDRARGTEGHHHHADVGRGGAAAADQLALEGMPRFADALFHAASVPEQVALRAAARELGDARAQALAQRPQRVLEDEARDPLLEVRPARLQALDLAQGRAAVGLGAAAEVGGRAQQVAPAQGFGAPAQVVERAPAGESSAVSRPPSARSASRRRNRAGPRRPAASGGAGQSMLAAASAIGRRRGIVGESGQFALAD